MKTILITGSSSGYGYATALHFLERGWNVVATMRAPKAGILPASDRLRVTRLDVTERASIDAAMADAIATFGSVDVVVSNAGIGLFSAFEATPEATVREVFETNTFGVMNVARAAIPHFRQQRAGLLINVTSSVAILPMPLVAPYCASKTAIEGFSESLAYELALFGAGVKIVQPGYGPGTSFTANGAARMEGLLPDAYGGYAQQLFAGLGQGKTTAAPDVAAAVYRAATDGSTRLRYAAGADAEDLAELRRAMPGEEYLGQARATMSPKAQH